MFRTTMLVAVLATAALVAPAAASAAPHATIPTDCIQQVTKPKQIVVACADAGFVLRGLHWRHWGDSRARATGKASVNACVPNCVSGKFRTYDGVDVVASKLRRCNGRLQYTRLDYEFTEGTPFPDRTGDVTFDCIKQPPSQRVYLPSTCRNQRFEPRQVVITCADANFVLRDVRWRGWGGDSATGTANAVVNTCDPTCVAGTFKTYTGVQVVASDVKTCKNDRQQYTKVAYRFTGRHPKGLRKESVTYPC